MLNNSPSLHFAIPSLSLWSFFFILVFWINRTSKFLLHLSLLIFFLYDFFFFVVAFV